MKSKDNDYINEFIEKLDNYLKGNIGDEELGNYIETHPEYKKGNKLFKKLEYISYHSPVLEEQIKKNIGWVLLRKMIGNIRNENKINNIIDKFIEIG